MWKEIVQISVWNNPDMALRADAQRNLEQIIAAAKQVFIEQGPEVPMEEIARAAGVGVGTLYRRFPDREALIRAVTRANFDAVLAETRSAMTEEPTAWDTLRRFFHLSRELRLSVQLNLVHMSTRRLLFDDTDATGKRDELIELLEQIVAAAQHEGTLRADVSSGDIAMLVSLLVGQTRREWTPAALLGVERAIALILDGLRAGTGTELPGQPVPVAAIAPQKATGN